MGPLVHARECGEATSVAGTSFHQTSSPKFENVVPLEFAVSSTVAKNSLLL